MNKKFALGLICVIIPFAIMLALFIWQYGWVVVFVNLAKLLFILSMAACLTIGMYLLVNS